jgi:hypothetical protein
MFTLWCRLADIDATFSSLVSLLQAINYQWCHCYCYHGVDENPGQGCKTGEELITSVIDTSKHKAANISEFL